MLDKFNEKAQKAIVLAESIAFDLGHSEVGSEHILLALMKMGESKLKTTLNKKQIFYETIKEDVIDLLGSSNNHPFYMEYTSALRGLLDRVAVESKRIFESKISLETLTIILLETKESIAVDILNKRGINVDALKKEIKREFRQVSELDSINDLININQKVLNNDTKIIGRTSQTEQLIHVLLRKEKANPLIIGEPGVGKTAIVENLATLINEDKTDNKLANKIIYELDLASVIAGTKYRGEFEEKLKKIIKKVKENKNAIIFIDEIHNVVGAGGAEGAIDAANILKPYLARNEFVCIGATTFDEYYKYLEKDKALERRFQLIILEETTKEETLDILKGLKDRYESFHNIKIPNNALNTVIELSDLYIKNRHFPDKALDVLDNACVKTSTKKLKKMNKEVVINAIEDFAKVKINDINRIEVLKKELKKCILGQNNALEKVIEQLSFVDMGLIDETGPLSVMLFVGPTGVGKTEVAKIIARSYFGDESKLIRVDMSEYMESHSISKLIGSPPGYVGHDNTGVFTDQVKKMPFSVILLDEVEKAHKDVLNLFLQIFDDGYLTDSQKRKISFRNTVIILTSNLGYHKDLFNKKQLGFIEENNKNDLIEKAIKNHFASEFINRIDEIIYFNTLQNNDYSALTKMYLNKYKQNLNLDIEISNELIDEVLTSAKVEDYGVREIKRSIKKTVFPKVLKNKKKIEQS